MVDSYSWETDEETMPDQSAGCIWPEQEVIWGFLEDLDVPMGQHDISELCNNISRYRLEIRGKLEQLQTDHEEEKRQHQAELEALRLQVKELKDKLEEAEYDPR